MGDAIGQMLVPAITIAIAISPLPLIAVVLMLATPRGHANGTAFTAGWVVSLGALVTVIVPAGSGADAAGDEGPATWTYWLKLVLGALFLLMGANRKNLVLAVGGAVSIASSSASVSRAPSTSATP
ncbi:GAP family protein [Streptomyces sp. NPDC001661]